MFRSHARDIPISRGCVSICRAFLLETSRGKRTNGTDGESDVAGLAEQCGVEVDDLNPRIGSLRKEEKEKRENKSRVFRIGTKLSAIRRDLGRFAGRPGVRLINHLTGKFELQRANRECDDGYPAVLDHTHARASN